MTMKYYVYACINVLMKLMYLQHILGSINIMVMVTYGFVIVLNICVSAPSINQSQHYVNDSYRDNLLNVMNTQRQNDQFTDVTLVSGDCRAKCHRSVLAAASPYFQTMFLSDLPESKSATVTLKINPAALELIVDYMYTAEITATADNVQSLVEACGILLLNDLKSICDQFTLPQLEIANCIGMFRNASLYGLQRIQEAARRLMTADFVSVVSTNGFMELSSEELVQYISDDDVSVDSEDAVLESVLKWVRHDPDERKTALVTILESVRLQFCTGIYLNKVLDSCDVLTPETRSYLKVALKLHVAPTSALSGTCNSPTTARFSYRMKRRVLVVGGTEMATPVIRDNTEIRFWHEGRRSWEVLTHLKQSYSGFGVCMLDNGLLLTGGRHGGLPAKCCWKFDRQHNTWTELPPLNGGRTDHSCVVVGSVAFVVGGRYSSGSYYVESLDHNQRQWSPVPNKMPESVYTPLVVGCEKGFYVFDNSERHPSTQFFTIAGEWQVLADIPNNTKCNGATGVMLNGYVYLLGGMTNMCMRYEPTTDCWTKLGVPTAVMIGSAVVWHGRVLLVGGNGYSSDIRQYDPVTDQWSLWETQLWKTLSGASVFSVDI